VLAHQREKLGTGLQRRDVIEAGDLQYDTSPQRKRGSHVGRSPTMLRTVPASG